jgi:nucleotide-binding universal stress UspA family protein
MFIKQFSAYGGRPGCNLGYYIIATWHGGLLETTNRRKILLAFDGSEQSLEAVRYISTILPPEKTDMVLFSVGTGFPEVFWDMNNNPLYRSKKTKVMGWLADHQLAIGEFKEKALKILTDAGFREEAICVKTQTKRAGILKDIIQESYQNYSAIVVGRSGVSRLKDLIFGSMAPKLADKIKHIPTIIVGGKPVSRKIMIALDESIEAMRGVSSAGALAGHCDPEITICHCLKLPAMSRIAKGQSDTTEGGQSWQEYNENRFRPYMDEATQRLVDAGIDAGRISRDFLAVKGNTIHKIIETAFSGNFGTIVVGRREVISFTQEHFRGRFSEKIIKSLDNMAVWVVS